MVMHATAILTVAVACRQWHTIKKEVIKMAVAKTIYIDDDFYRVLEKLRHDDVSFNAYVNRILLSYVLGHYKYLSDDDIIFILTSFIKHNIEEFRDFIANYLDTK